MSEIEAVVYAIKSACDILGNIIPVITKAFMRNVSRTKRGSNKKRRLKNKIRKSKKRIVWQKRV